VQKLGFAPNLLRHRPATACRALTRMPHLAGALDRADAEAREHAITMARDKAREQHEHGGASSHLSTARTRAPDPPREVVSIGCLLDLYVRKG